MLFSLGLASGGSLFSGFARHIVCARAMPNGETLICDPGLEDTAGGVQSVGSDNAAPDMFAFPETDVEDALESEREMIRGLHVEGLWIEPQGWFGWMRIGRRQSVDESGFLWRGEINGVVVKDTSETF